MLIFYFILALCSLSLISMGLFYVALALVALAIWIFLNKEDNDESTNDRN